jgi:hypothetical protein
VNRPWIYANPKTALRGTLSAGPAELAIRHSSAESARAAIAAIAPYGKASGEYHLKNKFRSLIART